jgi:hypothetical protein
MLTHLHLPIEFERKAIVQLISKAAQYRPQLGIDLKATSLFDRALNTRLAYLTRAKFWHGRKQVDTID